MIKPRVLTVSILLILLGCAIPSARITQTPSGRPEVEIHTSNVFLVTSEIITTMQTAGFDLQNDTEYSLVFERELKGQQAVFANKLIGNSSSTPPVLEISYLVSQKGDHIKIVEYSSIATQMASGQVNRMHLKDNDPWFNQFNSFLQRVKSKFDSQ
jgi:hypothetical protein